MSDAKAPPEIPGLVTGQKACFKFMIPTAWGVQDKLTGTPKMMQQMGFVPCIKADCALWNAEKTFLPEGSGGECWEVTRSRAIAKIENHKWNEVVGSEH